ncbi:MAG: hypothetical protein PHV68_09425 [Candidatus Gastranaerophilales bacterium]|nr:hypothetical protein [Candidatus Gastranaerophilales bacterium]
MELYTAAEFAFRAPMNPREIVAKAWTITTREDVLRKWGFASAFCETIIKTQFLVYQGWILYSYIILKNHGEFFGTATKALMDLPIWLTILIATFAGLVMILEWLFPHFAKGAIVGLAAKSYRKEEMKGGLVLAVYNFFPLFAVHQLLFVSSITTAITMCSFLLRYGSVAAIPGVIIVLIAWMISNILEFFWVFSEEAIVLRKVGIGAAIRRSCKLVISYLGHIVFIMLLLFVIMLRIIANLLMVIIIPGAVLGIGFLLALFLPPTISYSLAALLGVGIILAASYLFAYLEIFRQTVWTLTFMELDQLKDLDIIDMDGKPAAKVANEAEEQTA